MIATLIALALPAVIWSVLMLSGTGQLFEMDWGGQGGTFAAYLHPHYSRLFGIIFWVGLVFGMFIGIAFRQEPAGILVLSAVYAHIFNLWVTFCYESYLHVRYPPDNAPSGSSRSIYTRRRYAITLSLAYSSVILFVVGLLSAVKLVVSR